ncbi:MAG TPA: phosphopentomutase [Ignavibacteriaceae bacterium]|nr:phosphopentomutase [Ignavibacteriaceae bacterium]
MNNFFLIILDGVGVGELPDAAFYGDQGSSTLPNIARYAAGLNLPQLRLLGLGNIVQIDGVEEINSPLASFGKMKEVSKGKDSTTGHWEIAGLYVDMDFSYFPDGFPKTITDNFLKYTGCKGFLGNKPASGTEIIKELGNEHMKTGFPIIYTSADSVFQIAAHEEIIPLRRLYEICSLTRNKVLALPWLVGRVIARPFIGSPGNFTRTTNRKDFSMDPPQETILDILLKNNITTVAIGKINDLFNYRGIKIREETKSNREGMEKLLKYTKEVSGAFIFTNLVDFDVYFGHRNDPAGFAKALEDTDHFFKIFTDSLDESDALIITSDHGNDPTTPSTDHSREYVPLLYYRRNQAARNLGTRETFSDVAKTAAEFFKVENDLKGKSFLFSD